jgi:hypothetical protein
MRDVTNEARAARRRRRWRVAAGTVFFILASTVMASATVPDGSGVFHACYLTSGAAGEVGKARIVDSGAGQACTASETAVTWRRGLLFRGAWVSSTAYKRDDIVTRNGSSFVALVNSTNVTPGTDAKTWSTLAAKGNPGPPGPAATALWARVVTYADGSIYSVTGTATSVTQSAVGSYVVTFPITVAACAAVVTPNRGVNGGFGGHNFTTLVAYGPDFDKQLSLSFVNAATAALQTPYGFNVAVFC